MLPLVCRLIARLPLSWLRALGALLGLVVYAASARYRGRLRANLARAGHPASMRLRAACEAGVTAAELPWIWFRPARQTLARVRCRDHSALTEALAAGRGVLLLTPHLGGFEVTPRWLAALGPITIIYRQARQAPLERLLKAARNQSAMAAAPAGLGGLRAMRRALQRGEMVGLLPDQVPGAGDGRWAPFLGAPAYTMTLPQRLVEVSGAAVVLVSSQRCRGGWALRFARFQGEPTPEAVNRAMEDLIGERPAQYLWSYNRFKQPAGAPAADQAARS
ncbi:MAG: lysophospholipid acyltransferase family protein [Burkholderiales bacterium]|jgi:KDO2-lipid IV(A) lauroyltransferase